MKCPRCGQPVLPSMKTCPHCNASLQGPVGETLGNTGPATHPSQTVSVHGNGASVGGSGAAVRSREPAGKPQGQQTAKKKGHAKGVIIAILAVIVVLVVLVIVMGFPSGSNPVSSSSTRTSSTATTQTADPWSQYVPALTDAS